MARQVAIKYALDQCLWNGRYNAYQMCEFQSFVPMLCMRLKARSRSVPVPRAHGKIWLALFFLVR
eukprot:6934917-Karenia_brevis.AAC.1